MRLLQTVKSKLTPSGGAVLIAEMLLDDDGTGPAPALLQSLNMLVQTHGRERTNAEYQALLAAAGFNASAARFVRTGSYLDAILVEWSDH